MNSGEPKSIIDEKLWKKTVECAGEGGFTLVSGGLSGSFIMIKDRNAIDNFYHQQVKETSCQACKQTITRAYVEWDFDLNDWVYVCAGCFPTHVVGGKK
jgi:hypothetical protein